VSGFLSTRRGNGVIIRSMSITRVYRLVQLVTMLRSGRRYDANALADELGVSKRTVFRDLNNLAEAGIPYYFDDQAGSYSIKQWFFLPAINLTFDEALALILTTRKMIGQLPVPLFHHVANAAIEIESTLPRAIQDHCGSFLDQLDVRWPALADDNTIDETFREIRIAIEQRRKVRLRYESLFDTNRRGQRGKTIEAVLSPYRLVFIHRAWYVIGHSKFHNETRTFKLSRITRTRILEELFVPDPQFTLDDYFGDAWVMIPEGQRYHVELIFSAKVATNVAEVQWHRTQNARFLDDGSLKFSVTVDGLHEISWWILGYGDQVRVVKPAQLAKMIQKTAAAVATMYQSQAKTD